MKQNENGKKIKETIKNRMSWIGSWKSWSKRRKLTTGICGVCVIVVVAGAISIFGSSDTEVIYKETTVKYGTLVKGVTESGSVDIGTVDQTFDLDMSALQRTDTSGSSSSGSSSGGSSGSTAGSSSGSGGFGGMSASGGGAQGGLDMFGQIFNMGGSSSGSNGDDSTLTVAEVVVSVGQQVSEGDPLYLLEEDSVSDLEDELQSNVEKAKADLEAVEADQTLSKQQAKYTYDSSTAYGSYIDTEYSTTLQELQNTVDSAESTLEQAKSSLEDYRAQLEEVTAAYEDAAQVLSNCKYSLNSTDAADDTYGYVYYAQLTEQAQSTADSLEQQKEELEQRVEQAEENVTTAETAYNKAKRELGQGKLTAAETKKLRTLAYNTAQETYDIALGYLEQDLSDQQETYDETLEKWNEFSTYIDGNAVCARYNGVITGVDLEAGDKISTGTSLVTLYDMDEVTITVTVDEDDMTDISLGSAANIALTAYPEDIFTAKVTAIGDATSDSSGNITYDVTVTLEGDVSGLFQGMTGDVTFVTEQTEEVLYVSCRAIITEDDKTYVKVKTADGSIVKKEITTGLSDDSNVEISGDIAEGDTVLIESSITK